MHTALALCLILVLFVVLLGNPRLGPHVYQDYDYGYAPSTVALAIAMVLVFFLLGGHLR